MYRVYIQKYLNSLFEEFTDSFIQHMSVIKFIWIGISCCIGDYSIWWLEVYCFNLVSTHFNYFTHIHAILLEKRCVTIEILLHWLLKMIGITLYTFIFSLGSGFVHVYLSSAYFLVLLIELTNFEWTEFCGPMSQQKLYDKDSSLLNA